MRAYTIVFRDHEGNWHAVGVAFDWDDANHQFGAMLSTLQATDYYDDCPPTVAKIVDGSLGAGQAYYDSALALKEALS